LNYRRSNPALEALSERAASAPYATRLFSRWLPRLGAVLVVLSGCNPEQSAYIGEADDYHALKDASPEPSACGASPRAIFNNSNSPYQWGDEGVAVEVNIAGDFRCPYCIGFALDIQKLWDSRPDYQRSVRVYYHHYPLEELHPGTTEMHVAAAAAALQDNKFFWELYQEIVRRRSQGHELDIDEAEAFLAKRSSFDPIRFDKERKESELKDFVQWDKRQGRAAGVRGTPTVFVCDEEIAARNTLEQRIDEILASSSE
jgi:protein-disulfide isomerase